MNLVLLSAACSKVLFSARRSLERAVFRLPGAALNRPRAMRTRADEMVRDTIHSGCCFGTGRPRARRRGDGCDVCDAAPRARAAKRMRWYRRAVGKRTNACEGRCGERCSRARRARAGSRDARERYRETAVLEARWAMVVGATTVVRSVQVEINPYLRPVVEVEMEFWRKW